MAVPPEIISMISVAFLVVQENVLGAKTPHEFLFENRGILEVGCSKSNTLPVRLSRHREAEGCVFAPGSFCGDVHQHEVDCLRWGLEWHRSLKGGRSPKPGDTNHSKTSVLDLRGTPLRLGLFRPAPRQPKRVVESRDHVLWVWIRATR